MPKILLSAEGSGYSSPTKRGPPGGKKIALLWK